MTINVRGVRTNMPKGTVVGRLTAKGAAQVVTLDQLANSLLARGRIASAQATTTLLAELVFSAPGLFGSGQRFSLAPVPKACNIGSSPATATAGSPAHTTATMYLVYNLALFLQKGAPFGVLAQIAWAAGNRTGTITFPNGTQALGAGQTLTMITPTPADAALGLLNCTFEGTFA